jgi:hypothetical protein
MAGRLTNFEIYGDDPEALAAFCCELLGWRIERAEGADRREREDSASCVQSWNLGAPILEEELAAAGRSRDR